MFRSRFPKLNVAGSNPVSRSAPSRRAVAGLVAALSIAIPVPVHATHAPENGELERMQKLFYEGSARYSAANYTGAIESFTAALEIVTRTGADPSVRGALLLNLAKSHVKAYDVSSEIRHLRTAREIYGRYASEAEPAGYPPDDASDATAQIAALEQQIASIEAASKPAPAPDGPTPPTTAGAADPGKGKRNLGIALAAGGGAFVAGGIGALVFGTTFKPAANKQIKDMMQGGTTEANNYLERETLKGNIWMGVGATMATVGAAGLAVGIVLMVKNKKPANAAHLRWAPTVARGTIGLSLDGRF